MPYTLAFTAEARGQLDQLKITNAKKHKKALKALGYLETNPKHPSLNVHQFDSVLGPKKEQVWEAYVENNTPAAYRILFYYGPDRGKITVLTIVSHP